MVSQSALKELKLICKQHGRIVSDEEALSIGERVIRYLKATKAKERQSLPPEEEKVLDLIAEGNSPSIREISNAIGRSSSRSGYRMVLNLMKKGLVARNEEGKLVAL